MLSFYSRNIYIYINFFLLLEAVKFNLIITDIYFNDYSDDLMIIILKINALNLCFIYKNSSKYMCHNQCEWMILYFRFLYLIFMLKYDNFCNKNRSGRTNYHDFMFRMKRIFIFLHACLKIVNKYFKSLVVQRDTNKK